VLAWLCFRVECTQSAVMLPWYAKNDCNRIWHYMVDYQPLYCIPGWSMGGPPARPTGPTWSGPL